VQSGNPFSAAYAAVIVVRTGGNAVTVVTSPVTARTSLAAASATYVAPYARTEATGCVSAGPPYDARGPDASQPRGRSRKP
jgi:hypothetical protein